MNNRRDDGGDDPASLAMIELVRRVPATPADPEMKRRVWAALAANEGQATAAPRVLRLPVVAAAAAILLAAGTAGAVIARRLVVPAYHRSPAATPAVAPAVSAPPREARYQAPAPPPVDVPAPAPQVMMPLPPPRPSARGARRAGGSDRVMPPVEAPAAAPSPRERAEVLDAMVALRRDRDPQRAGRLLDRYLAARPHGALREEALALAIEAADARGDEAGVANWARAYEADYPTGRFAAFARSHLKAP